MCTIGIVRLRHPAWPLLIVANRDELYARDATGPVVLQERGPRIVGGRDLISGGTWMGLNDAGIFVGVTNQRTFVGPDPTRASRGQVVLDALRCTTIDEVRALVQKTDARRYNEFNLLYGDHAALEVAYARQSARELRIAVVPPGVSVLPNDELNHPWFAKAAWLRKQLESPHELDELGALLGNHDKPNIEHVDEPPAGSRFGREMLRELSALCIHTPAYGTRSATVVALAGDGTMRYLFADGPPCRTSFTDHTELLASPS